jgi:hypothetical protein
MPAQAAKFNWRVARPAAAIVLLFSAGGQEWQSLFDGKSLRGWKETPVTGRGQVRVEAGAIVLGPGMPMTGVTWTGGFPQAEYEVRLEAARLQGNDFFASMTFPVGDFFYGAAILWGYPVLMAGTLQITKRGPTSTSKTTGGTNCDCG